ncbi:sister chromatid cohesion factor [Lasallia pustulata]|uniref:Sister chromatid cohesion factor n=1 Tax=Lasallia pustulata TaxID=136370 RepID=A0A1W5D7V7_9LECA|nr:sister chromatid cohesion factor [Lasallia pustulata]
MPLVSSPVAYPPSSSSPAVPEKRRRTDLTNAPFQRKRRLLDPSITEHTEESAAVDARSRQNGGRTKAAGPFVEDDDEEDPSLLALFHGVRGAAAPPSGAELPKDTVDSSPKLRQAEKAAKRSTKIRTSLGEEFTLWDKTAHPRISYEQLIASRSTAAPGRAKKSFYGIDIHKLLDDVAREPKKALDGARSQTTAPVRSSIELSAQPIGVSGTKTLMWTEKYRAKRFTDLVGDERTHRSVLRWLKRWDPIVFPGVRRPKPKASNSDSIDEEQPHRKILMLTGPPGLGKTTLAHVCARQAGYEVLEINASDERSGDVVRGRIRESVCTENVKGVNAKTAGGTVRKAGRPVCVVVDEVDGVVSSSSGVGEGGFIKALIDLVVLDQKNSNILGASTGNTSTSKRSKRGDKFRLLRPMILICNDVYHPALRPLRSSTFAEIIHIRKPPLDKVVARMKMVFDKESIANDGDGVRRLCEASWGISNRRESRSSSSNTGEGDIRGVLVVAECVAAKLRAASDISSGNMVRLTRQWVEQNVLADLSYGGGGARGLGRGGVKEAVERVFLDGAGFPKVIGSVASEDPLAEMTASVAGVSEVAKRIAMERLRDVVDTGGECDRVITDCFAAYPSQRFQDDTFLSKPNSAYEWLHFHDTLSSKVFSGQEWELSPYLSQSVLGFHHLFASPATHSWADKQKPWGEDGEEEPLPFTGSRADFSAFEAQKQNRSILLGLQSSLSTPLLRSFRSAEEIATDLLPHLIRILTPDVKPVVVGGSGEQRGTASVRTETERNMVRRAVGVMSGVGVSYERGRIEAGQGSYCGFVYRMEPPLDTLATFETSSPSGPTGGPTRYAVRQVLDQEYQKDIIRQQADARQARYKAGNPLGGAADLGATFKTAPTVGTESKKSKVQGAKRDFFGRIIINETRSSRNDGDEAGDNSAKQREPVGGEEGENKVWVSFHEGFSNAVRKPITLDELMRGL